jgi:predicted nucleic acid-binding protein
MLAVSDTSPINALQRIGQLHLLPALFDRVFIPPAVRAELQNAVQHGFDPNLTDQLGWLEVRPLSNFVKKSKLLAPLDLGESEAIALALELKTDYILIDEKAGRRIAATFGLQVIGVLGILLRAKEMGLIDAIKPALDDLVVKVGFWIEKQTRRRILELAEEL